MVILTAEEVSENIYDTMEPFIGKGPEGECVAYGLPRIPGVQGHL